MGSSLSATSNLLVRLFACIFLIICLNICAITHLFVGMCFIVVKLVFDILSFNTV